MLETSNLLFLAGVLLMTFTMVRMIRRRAQSSPDPRPPAPANNRPLPQPNIGEYESRLFDTFRELNARLETKIAVLNALVEEADRKMEELRTLNNSSVESATREEPLIVGMEKLDERVPSKSRELEANRRAHDGIYQLADRGLTPREISDKLNMPLAEIDLILGLRGRRKSG